jgi:dihydrofolate reductase
MKENYHMRKLRSTTFVSLDGVMQAPGGPEEDTQGGFTLGGWTVPHFDEHVGEAMGRFMAVPFDLLLGRRTYDIFAAFWPNASEEEGAGPLNAATKYVASHGRPQLDWERSVLLEGDVREAVRRLKEGDGPELQVHGSGDLLKTLLRHGLVDEMQLVVFPVVLGSGQRLFPDGAMPRSLRLLESSTSGTGVVISSYAVDGEVRTGSFAPDA